MLKLLVSVFCLFIIVGCGSQDVEEPDTGFDTGVDAGNEASADAEPDVEKVAKVCQCEGESCKDRHSGKECETLADCCTTDGVVHLNDDGTCGANELNITCDEE